MRIGFKALSIVKDIPMICEVVRPVESGELYDCGYGSIKLLNDLNNKWWAAPRGSAGPCFLMCFDDPKVAERHNMAAEEMERHIKGTLEAMYGMSL